MSDSLWPHGQQHVRLSYPSLLPKFSQTHVHRVGDAIQPSHPLSSPSPPALNLSQHQGLLKWVSSSHQVTKVLEFQLQHQSFQWIFRLISFRMDWLHLLAVQGTLKSLLKHHSSKASILCCSAFFILFMGLSRQEYWSGLPFSSPVRLPGEISITSDMQKTPPLWQKLKKN